MSDSCRADPPSRFVTEWAAAVASRIPPPRRALDVAMGRGRHIPILATAGYQLFGVDLSLPAVHDAMERATGSGIVLRGWVADLTQFPLPAERFELIVVTRYLQRDLFASLCEAVVPGGVILYETFTEAQRLLGVGPRSPAHLLAPGELRERFAIDRRFTTLFYEEAHAPDEVARCVAQRIHRSLSAE